MAVASVEEQVKLKDLWQPKYAVPMLKSMKTVAFETPSGQHSYNVVGANRRTNGDSTTTSIFCASGHQVKVTESSAMLLYPEALTGESDGVVERRLSQKVNGRYVEQIFMFHKNGRRLQDGRGERPAPGRPELLAKKGRIVARLSAELQNVREAPGKLGEARGSSDPLELCRKMLHFGKIPKNFGQNLAKIRQNLSKFAKFWKQTAKKFSNF